jgi:Glycoside Hydrolase Family 113
MLNARTRTVVSILLGLALCLPSEADVSGTLPRESLNAQTVRGVNYAHLHRRGLGYGSDASRRELANLRDLGVGWVALTTFGYQRSARQDYIAGYDPDVPLADFLSAHDDPLAKHAGRDTTLTDQHLAAQVRHAKELGVNVLIKPHIWSSDFWRGDDWHGTIDQPNPQAHERWRRSYLRFMLHHARLARDTNADALCIGTELVQQTLKHPDDWRTLIAEVRKVYKGKLTYAAHWDREFEEISFWDDLDAIGISAYFPLDVPRDAQVPQIVKAWGKYKPSIEKAYQRFGKPVVFLEIGYRPATNAFKEPWLDAGGEVDTAIQERAYEAMFRAFSGEPWWHGLFIWKTFTATRQQDDHGKGPGYSFRNQPAEEVIKRWFSQPLDAK